MYTPEKSLRGFKGMKNQIITFNQFSTIELTTNVALQETLPKIAVLAKSACSSSRSLWNYDCIMGLFTKPRISDSISVAPC